MKKPICLAEIRPDIDGVQARVDVDWDVVKDYAEAINNGDDFPPMTVFWDGSKFILADGFHRYWAYTHCDRPTERFDPAKHVKVIEGTAHDAHVYACGANKGHGLRLNNDDKKRILTFMLNDEETNKWSNREIARHVGVGHTTVDKYRKEREALDRRNAKKREDRASAQSGQMNPETHREVKRGDQKYTMKVPRPKPKPEPEEQGPPVDAEGQLITEPRLIEAFEATCLDDWLKTIKDLRAQIIAHHGDLACAYLPAQECTRQLKAVYDAIKASKPHTVTPKGTGRRWEDVGFLTKQQYERLAPEKRHEGTEAKPK